MYTEITTLLQMLEKTGKNYDTDKIKAAFLYAKQLHEGQFRLSGEAYIMHPVEVAEIVASLELDTDSLCAALLHDTVEDCKDKTSLDEIKSRFGDEVAMLVDGLTKMVQLQVENREDAQVENLRKMLLATSKDIRVVFIKLCDRLHNMRTLSAKPENRRRAIALETMYIYAPLAHRLGMQLIKHELENLSLSYLDPIGFDEVKCDIEKKYGQNIGFIENARAQIEEKLRENNITFDMEGRVKSVYSIYHKMFDQNKSFDEIFDFYALRVIVDTELECYTVLGIVHEMFKSMPGRFKDYISTPKPNMYRSLHTTVFGRGGVPFEVQIRTHEMHQIAEFGIAAHWKYKSGAKSGEELDKKLEWIARLIETEDNARDSEEFIEAIKVDIFHDEIFVFTPKGDVISRPLGSTVIDFAYAIHSEVGHKMIGAKLNGTIVPIDREPKTGDIIEIITSSSSKGPGRDWIKIVKTTEARNKIRQWFKKEKRSENIIVGRDEITKELKKHNRPFNDQQRDAVASAVASRIGVQSVEDLYNTVGFGGLAVTKIAGKLREEFDKVVKPLEEVKTEPVVQTAPIKNLRSGGGVVVDGEAGCMIKFAKCCNPLPGDDIIGFITRGYGVSIHKRDCPNACAGMANPDQAGRWVDSHWELAAQGSSQGLYEAKLSILCENKIGMLGDITSAIGDMKVSIIQLSIRNPDGDTSTVELSVGCKNTDHYRSIVSRLRSIDGVLEITRGFT